MTELKAKQFSTRISEKDKMQLVGNLSTMLKAGIPILETVDSLLEDSKGNLKKVLETMRADLKAGTRIHETLAKYPNAFNKVTINLIKAAEEAGTLEVALRDVREGIQREIEFSDKVKSALMYPVFVLVIFLGVMIMMLVFVMPRISQVFSRLTTELPVATRILIAASNFLLDNTVLVVGAVVFSISGFLLFYRYKKNVVANIIFSFPYISGLIRQIDMTRFSRSMALLLGSGLPIITALELAEDVIVKRDLQKLIEGARKQVSTGKRFSEGLVSQNKLVPSIVTKLIEVGERTGSLDESMKEITEMLDYEVTKNLRAATALLEPIMLVFVGLSVGAMMMAIIGPIYGLISNVGAR
ncbi:MAG: type II secretion system protein F [Patescibacteria group bacterium]|nr:MAG: type II secretion system protein F [Patescibacteria group bacterium]